MEHYKNQKIILGIDPGSTVIGYGAINYKKPNSKPKTLGYGYIKLNNCPTEAKKLLQLHEDLKELIFKYKPHSIAIEGVYFFKNLKTFSPVMQSKGVILFTAAKANINVFEYTPLQVKQTICGYGRGDKKLIHKMVQSSLDIRSNIQPDDASDALAIALCHLRHLTSL